MKKLSSGLGFLVFAFLLAAVPAAFAEEGEKDRWTGPYVGLVAGMGTGEVQETPDFERNQAKLDGGLFGVLAGLNYRVGNSKIIFGIGGRIEKGSISGSRTEDLCPGCPVSNTETTETRIDWLNQLYAEIGYDMGNILPKVFGGIVYGEAKISTRTERRFGGLVDTAGSWAKQGFVGSLFGVGVDYRITEEITVEGRLERTKIGLIDTANNSSFRGVDVSGNIAQVAVKMSF